MKKFILVSVLLCTGIFTSINAQVAKGHVSGIEVLADKVHIVFWDRTQSPEKDIDLYITTTGRPEQDYFMKLLFDARSFGITGPNGPEGIRIVITYNDDKEILSIADCVSPNTDLCK